MKINEFNTLTKSLPKSSINFQFPCSPFISSYCFDYQGQCFEYLGDEYWKIPDDDGNLTSVTREGEVQPKFRVALGDNDYDYVVDVPELEAELIKEAQRLGIMT